MKNLILILILCIFLFSCFEKEDEEVTVTEETPIENPADTTANDTTDVVVTPVDSVDIMQCEYIKQTINYIVNNPPRVPRAYSTKYIYNNEIVLYLYPGGNPENGSTAAINSKCDVACQFGGFAGNTCYDFWEEAVFIDTVWVDRR